MRALSRRMRRVRWLAGLVAAAAVGALAEQPEEFLRASLDLSQRDLRTIAKGEAILKGLEPGDNHDVGAAGVSRVNTTPEFFLERFRDITRFKSSDAVLQIGTFEVPPQQRDVAPLVWESDDLQALRECRVGDCGLRLSADAIVRFQREVDWAASDHEQQATRLANTMLVELATAYLQNGDSALPAYQDRSEPVSPSEEFLAVAAQSPSTLDLVPEFRDYLLGFPRITLPHVDTRRRSDFDQS